MTDLHAEDREKPGQPAGVEVQPVVDSRDLMQGDREIIIRHGDQDYRLSVTRSGKLILQK